MSLSPKQRERLKVWSAEHLKANAESRMASYRKSQHARTIALAVSIITFALLCAAYHFIGTYCLPPQ